MATPARRHKSVVSQGDANTIYGAVGGWQDAAVAAEAEFDLRSLEGRYVKVSCSAQGFWICFAAATAQALVFTDATTETAGVPELIPANSKDHVVVPVGFGFLRYKQAAGTDGVITVVRG